MHRAQAVPISRAISALGPTLGAQLDYSIGVHILARGTYAMRGDIAKAAIRSGTSARVLSVSPSARMEAVPHNEGEKSKLPMLKFSSTVLKA